jgi:hypothetical protein
VTPLTVNTSLAAWGVINISTFLPGVNPVRVIVLVPLAVGCQVIKVGPDKSTVRPVVDVLVAVVVIACAGKVQIVTAPVDVDTWVPVPAVILLTYPPATELAVTAVVTNVPVLNQTVTAPVDVDTLVPELPTRDATPIPPTRLVAVLA